VTKKKKAASKGAKKAPRFDLEAEARAARGRPKDAPRDIAAEAAAHVREPWQKTMATKTYSGADARARIEAAQDLIGTFADDAGDGTSGIAGVMVDEYRLAVTCSCSTCSADVGELCVEVTKGSRTPKVKHFACKERVAAAEAAAALIARTLARQSGAVEHTGRDRPRIVAQHIGDRGDAGREAGTLVDPSAMAGAPVVDDAVAAEAIRTPAPKDRGGQAERDLGRGAPVADPRGRLPNGCAVWISWPGSKETCGAAGPAKRAQLVRYTAKGDPVVRVFAVDARGAYTGELGRAERILTPAELLGPINRLGPDDTTGDAYRKDVADAVAAIAPATPGDPEPTRPRKTKKEPSAIANLFLRNAMQGLAAGAATYVRCVVDGCPAKFSGSMPPDWKNLNRRPHCPVHAREVLARRWPAPAQVVVRTCASPTGCSESFEMDPTNPSVPPAWTVDNDWTWRCPGHSVVPVVAKEVVPDVSARFVDDPDSLPAATVAEVGSIVRRGLELPAAQMCAHHDAPGVRCAKTFHAINPPRGWTRTDDPADVLKSAYFCPQHNKSLCRHDIHFCQAPGCDAYCFGAYRMAGWTIVTEADGSRRYYCPRTGHGLARDAAAVASTPPRIGAPPLPPRPEAVLEAVLASTPRPGEPGSPHHRDTGGTCGACDESFRGGMPSRWEWWRGHFWCPTHVPAEVVASDAASVDPGERPPWE
jgi:hypothetical protein